MLEALLCIGDLAAASLSQGVSNGGTQLDLLVTIPVLPTTYSASPELVSVSGQAGYLNPAVAFRQALLTDLGYACLGTGVRPAVCGSGTNVFDLITGNCADGSGETDQGALLHPHTAPSALVRPCKHRANIACA